MLRLTLLAQLSLLSIWNLQFYHPLGVPFPEMPLIWLDVKNPTQSHHHWVMQTGASGWISCSSYLILSFPQNVLSPGSTQIFYVSKILPRTPIIIPPPGLPHWSATERRSTQAGLLQREESNLTLFSSEPVLFPLSTPSMGRFVSSSSSSIFSHQTALAAFERSSSVQFHVGDSTHHDVQHMAWSALSSQQSCVTRSIALKPVSEQYSRRPHWNSYHLM